jgi:hypothetical protein
LTGAPPTYYTLVLRSELPIFTSIYPGTVYESAVPAIVARFTSIPPGSV